MNQLSLIIGSLILVISLGTVLVIFEEQIRKLSPYCEIIGCISLLITGIVLILHGLYS